MSKNRSTIYIEYEENNIGQNEKTPLEYITQQIHKLNHKNIVHIILAKPSSQNMSSTLYILVRNTANTYIHAEQNKRQRFPNFSKGRF